MSGFQEASLVEERGAAILIEYAQESSFEGRRLVVIGSGRHAKEMQKVYGDVMRNPADEDGRRIETIEFKSEEENSWGNLFLERWSNLDADRDIYTPGWMEYCRADLLWYYFIASDELYEIHLPKLRRWAFVDDNLRRYELKRQNKYKQANNTFGYPVPIAHLKSAGLLKAIAPGPKAFLGVAA